MAKKPKASGGGCAVFMIGFIVFVIIEPVVLFGAVFYFAWKMYQIKLSGKTSIADYWLSKNEKEYFLESLEEWRVLFRHRKELERRAEELEQFADENNISKNADGTYSRRSALGKQIMSEFDSLNAEYSRVKVREDAALERNEFYESRPERRWLKDKEDFIQKDLYRKQMWVALIGLIVWAVGYLIFEYREQGTGLFFTGVVTPIFVGVLYWYQKKQNEKLVYPVPMPPEVTEENLNDYTYSGETDETAGL